MKKTIIFVAGSIIYMRDGYNTRIEMEMEKLKNKYNVILFIPNLCNEDYIAQNGIEVEKYDTKSGGQLSYLYNMHSFKNALNKLCLKYENVVICAESLGPAIKSYRIAKNNSAKFIYECHGTEPDEFALNHPGIKGKIMKTVLEHLQRTVLKTNPLLITVTKNQADILNYSNFIILPMMPSKAFIETPNMRSEARKALNIPAGAEVFVYSGQNQKWQMCEETVQIFKKISKKNPQAFLLILTGQKDYFKTLIDKYEIANYVIHSSKYEDMPFYLDACDYGFCIRNSSIINRVASPTKVLEYLARNIKPIISEYVGDFSVDLPSKGLACVWNDNCEISKDDSFNGKNYVIELDKNVTKCYDNKIASLFNRDVVY